MSTSTLTFHPTDEYINKYMNIKLNKSEIKLNKDLLNEENMN